MRVLAIDTALGACQAALLDAGVVTASRSEPMVKGHQERLAPMVQAVLADAGVRVAELERIGLTVGPGSFTGLRVGLSFAKGLSLGLGVPCIGVGTLEALATHRPTGVTAAVIDARRERLYLQLFRDGAAISEPELIEVEGARGRLARLRSEAPVQIVGPAASLLTREIGSDGPAVPDIGALARLAARADAPVDRPAPLYLRAPDARTIAERLADRAPS